MIDRTIRCPRRPTQQGNQNAADLTYCHEHVHPSSRPRLQLDSGQGGPGFRGKKENKKKRLAGSRRPGNKNLATFPLWRPFCVRPRFAKPLTFLAGTFSGPNKPRPPPSTPSTDGQRSVANPNQARGHFHLPADTSHAEGEEAFPPVYRNTLSHFTYLSDFLLSFHQDPSLLLAGSATQKRGGHVKLEPHGQKKHRAPRREAFSRPGHAPLATPK